MGGEAGRSPVQINTSALQGGGRHGVWVLLSTAPFSSSSWGLPLAKHKEWESEGSLVALGRGVSTVTGRFRHSRGSLLEPKHNKQL